MPSFSDGSKFFQTPSYTAAEWATRNPVLLKGERGYELHPITGIPWRAKIGDGVTAWNTLPFELYLYPYSDVVTNPVGDASGNLQYLPIADIIKLMLNPFYVPVLFTPEINVNGAGYAASRILEIGQTINSPVLVKALPDVGANLDGTSPYNITAGGVFGNEGNFAAVPASLTLSPLTPSAVTEILISIKGKAANGKFTNILTSLLAVYPKIIWGVSNATSLVPGDWASLTARQTLITKDYKADYAFNANGYLYIAIPSMIAPSSFPDFTDITGVGGNETLAVMPIDFQDQGVQSINNGVGTYNYKTYRSVFSMNSSTIVRVR